MASNKRLNATVTIGGAVAGSLKTAVGSTASQLGRIGEKVTELTRKQKLLSESIRTFGGMGKNVDNLRAKYAAVTKEIDELTAARERAAAVEEAEAGNADAIEEIKADIGETVALSAALLTPVVMAAKFETAMLGVAKQMDGARDEAGNLTPKYHEMARAVQRLGRDLPIATNEIAEMVAAGLRMGISSDNVVDYVRKTAEMATAFELPVEQLAEDMGKIANMYKIPIPAIGDLADSINYLDDNAIAKGGDIIDILQRVGGTAGMVKITAKETAALASTLLTAGERAETAGTAMNAIFSKLGAATTGAKDFQDGLAMIKMRPDDIQAGMQKDAVGTILKVVGAIKKLKAVDRVSATSLLFGQEHWDTFSKLLNNTDELRKQIALANSDAAKGSMSREFAARMQTTNAMWETTKNRLVEIGVNIGTVLLPVVKDVVTEIGKITSAVADWSIQNPELTKAIVGTVAAVSALKVGIMVARIAFVSVQTVGIKIWSIFVRVRNSMATVRAVLFNVWHVARMIGVTLATTPWGIAAAVLVAGAVLVFKYWDRIKAFFGGFWTGLKKGLEPIRSAFAGLGESLSFLGPVFDAMGRGIGVVVNWFKELLGPVKETPESLGRATSAGERFGQLVGGAISAVLWPLQKLIEGFTWISNNAGNILGKVGDATSNAGSAIGGVWNRAKNAVGLGDNNQPPPMLRRPPDVPPASARGAATQQNNTFNITATPGMNEKMLADEVAKRIKKQDATKQRSNMNDGAYAQ